MNLGLLGSLLCILGFFLITAALYSDIQIQQQQNRQPNNYNTNNFEVDGDWGFPDIRIFAAPRPFSYNGSDSVGARQELAVRSWLGLSSNVRVVLFGQHPSVHQFASSLGNRVIVESGIDFT